jgi:hypothetical protein
VCFVKILIEDPATSKFLAANGSWTKSSKDAFAYRSSTLAKQAGEKIPIGRFNVVGAFANSPQLTNLDEGCGLQGEAK